MGYDSTANSDAERDGAKEIRDLRIGVATRVIKSTLPLQQAQQVVNTRLDRQLRISERQTQPSDQTDRLL